MPVTQEQRTQEEISASIKNITKMLGPYAKSSAELKKEEKEKKDLLKQEKLLQEKWMKVVDDQKEAKAKETQSFKSMTGLISLETQKYFELTKENHVTWSGLATSIKTGVKNWFDAASKQRTMLGRTLRLGASLWQAAHKHIIDNVRKLWGAVTGQINEVLGELGGVLNWIKDSFMSVFKFIGSTFMGFFKKVPPHDRRRNKLLQALVSYARRREKRDLLQKPKDKKVGLLGTLALIAAATLGAIIGKFLLPFKATLGTLMKAMKVGPIMKAIIKFMGKIPIIGKLFNKIGGFFGKLGKLWKWLGKKIPFLSKLVKWFRFGFTKLAWPLQIILSVIDFIKGFMATEGNLADKIIGGIKNALFKFFELPVKLIGWIIEKVLGLFGVEVDGIADKMMGFLKGWWDAILSLLRPIIGFFEGFFTTEGSIIDKFKAGIGGFFTGLEDTLAVFKELWDKFKAGIGGFFTGLEDTLAVFKELWDKIVAFKEGLLSWFKGDEEEEEPTKPTTDTGKKSSSWYNPFSWGGEDPTPDTTSPDSPGVKTVANAQAKKNAQVTEKQTDELKKTLDENTKKQIDANKEIAEKGDAATAIAMGGNAQSPPAETPVDPLKDEIEIFGLLGGNNNF